MKQKLQMIIGASAAMFLTFSAPAQDASKISDSNDMPGVNQQTAPKHTTVVGHIIGMTVKNYQNDNLGKVVDMAVDVKTGRIVEVILSRGGFLGFNITFTAVPPEILHQDAGHKVLRMDASVAKFKAAPGFDSATWNLSTQSGRVTEIYACYGLQPDVVPGQGDLSLSAVALGSELSQYFGMQNNLGDGGMTQVLNWSKSSKSFKDSGHLDAFGGFALDYPESVDFQFMISPVLNPRNVSPAILGRAVQHQPEVF